MTKDQRAEKATLRQIMRHRRSTQAPQLGAQLSNLVLDSQIISPRAIIGGFMPLAGEIDILPLLNGLYQRGYQVSLPQTPPAGHPLVFRAWTPETPMQAGRFGTQHPDAPLLTPDFLLIPLLAFDLAGNRLGYGGGYYDRTIAALPGAFRLGCAYEIQKVEHVPTEPTDQTLQAIATEKALTIF